SDAMQINGINRLACKVLVKDLLAKKGKTTITVAPLKGLPLLKDLYVDMEPFFEAYRSIKPYLITYGNEPTRERIQSPAERAQFAGANRSIQPYLIAYGNEPTRERIQSPAERAQSDDTTTCILCAACTTSCPVYWADGSYFGPAAIVNAHRFIFDSRDEGAEE